jgi:hypothetical protein
MPKFTDYYSDPEVRNIMEKFIAKFPGLFEGFNVDGIHVVVTRKKKSRKPIRLRTVGYPTDVFIDRPYIVEVFDAWWTKMDVKQKNLAVFHIMCAVPQGGFDPGSSHYAKKVRPDIEMYLREFAASGGVPNWMENPAARDPFDIAQEDIAAVPKDDDDAAGDDGEPSLPEADDGPITRIPVTREVVANVGA